MQVVLNVDGDSENLYSQVMEAAHQYLKDENRLTNIRQYLEALRHTEFVINEDITEVRALLTFNVDNEIFLFTFPHFAYIFTNPRIDIILLYSNNLCYFTCLVLYVFRLFRRILWRCEAQT